MRVLYAIQGTGNGHLSRAAEILPFLLKKCTVDILVSGNQSEIKLRYPVKYQLKGLGFVSGKDGGINFWKTYSEADLISFQKEVRELPVEQYNFILNDFEPVSAWAAKYKNIPCISLSHQASLLSSKVPKPKSKDLIGAAVLKHYAPANHHFGFHFSPYDSFIYTPIIKREIRRAKVKDKDHYTVYLPAFSDEKLLKVFGAFENVTWHIFSKHAKRKLKYNNITIFPVSEEQFITSLTTGRGVVSAAGFETPSEALYLGKKLLVIPQKNQLEQLYNAAALKTLGVTVIKNLKPKNVERLRHWIDFGESIKINYPDKTDVVVNKVFETYLYGVTRPSLTRRIHGRAKRLVELMLD